jgi:DNA repair protein RadC
MKIKGYSNKQISNPEDISKIFQAILQAENEIDQDKEHFWTIGLNVRNGIKYIELVSLGTLNASLVHPREVYRMAIFEGIAQILLIHNHPSGNTDPSEDDLTIVKRIAEAGKIIGITVIDSLIITEDQYFSWKEKKLL